MKIIGTGQGCYIAEITKAELAKFCGIQNGSDNLDGVYIGNEYTISPVFEHTSKALNAGVDFSHTMNALLTKLNEVHTLSKNAIDGYHEVLPHARALVDHEMKSHLPNADRYNTRKVTLHENPPTFTCGRHD